MTKNKLFLFLTTVFLGFSMSGYTAASGGAGGSSLYDAQKAIIDTMYHVARDHKMTDEEAAMAVESTLIAFKAAYDAYTADPSDSRRSDHEVDLLIRSVAPLISASTEFTKNAMRFKVLAFLKKNFAHRKFNFTPLKEELPYIKVPAIKTATENLLRSVH